MVDSTNLPKVDINAIATDLNNKMDRDGVNASDTGNIQMAHNAMPSDKYIDLSSIIPLNSGVPYSYTAPADGYLFFNARSTAAGQFLGCWNDSLYTHIEVWAYNSGCIIQPPLLPMRKGQTINDIRCNFTPTDKIVRFIYAVGSVSEAS